MISHQGDIIFMVLGIALLLPGSLGFRKQNNFARYGMANQLLMVFAGGVLLFLIGAVDYFNLYHYLQPILKYWEY